MIESSILNGKFGTVSNASDSGVEFGYTPDFFESVRAEFIDIFGADFDVTEQTAAGRIIEAGVRTMVNCVGTVALNAGQVNVDESTGKYLDTLANLNDLTRIERRVTSVVCRFKGIPGTVVMGGFELVDAKYRSLWTGSAITLDGNGSADVVAFYGDVVTEDIADGIASIRPRHWIKGVESVTSTSAVVVGRETESDESLRARLKALRRENENYCVEITNRVMALDGVLSCFTYENRNHYNVFIDKNKNAVQEYISGETIQVSAHSMICIVDFDTERVGDDGDHAVSEEELNYAIAQIIYMYRSCGCAMTPLYRNQALVPSDPNDHVPVSAAKAALCVVRKQIDGYGYEMLFNKNEVVEYGIIVKVRKNTYANTANALAEEIRSALSVWQSGGVSKVDKQSVGRSVYAFEIAAAISNVIPEIQVADVKIGIGNNPNMWTNTIIGMMISQRAHCTINTNTRIYVDGTLVS